MKISIAQPSCNAFALKNSIAFILIDNEYIYASDLRFFFVEKAKNEKFSYFFLFSNYSVFRFFGFAQEKLKNGHAIVNVENCQFQ